ncbi:MAG: response regulator [Pseudomonas sp.]|uniref:response regulator n=1 Tax=Pseudomonas sp. TaxID=306 RepID=UPI003391AAE8
MPEINTADPLSTSDRKIILLVEDDEVVRMLTAEVLEELGYQVHEAEDATQALPLLESDQPLDLLMTDISLPGMSGRELMEKARQLRPDLPVLFASGYAEEDHGSARPSKVATITKPFSLDLLRTKVRSMLGQA